MTNISFPENADAAAAREALGWLHTARFLTTAAQLQHLPAPGVPDQKVYVGIRPEGFIPDENGPFSLDLTRIEVMGRDISVVAAHPQAQAPSVRAIISSESEVGAASKKVRFSLKPKKVYLFAAESEERIRF